MNAVKNYFWFTAPGGGWGPLKYRGTLSTSITCRSLQPSFSSSFKVFCSHCVVHILHTSQSSCLDAKIERSCLKQLRIYFQHFSPQICFFLSFSSSTLGYASLHLCVRANAHTCHHTPEGCSPLRALMCSVGFIAICVLLIFLVFRWKL